MKFSILIPTRDRLELLRHTVESVRMQDYADWEIIVSDNASEQDVAGYVSCLAEPRVRYSRTASLLPVTDNWNRALERSSGDYLIMLGDDDALLPGCLRTGRAVIERFGQPDAIYTEALQYAYPGVVPGHADPFVQTGFNEFLRDALPEPFLLPRSTAERVVHQATQFRMRYGFNMQHFIFSRRLVEALRPRGPFFQSPYPDYYAANAILLAARSVVANPRPLVLIGISPRSFGFYHQNRREAEGVQFLQNFPSPEVQQRLRRTLVPGSNMNDSWLCAMETLAGNFVGTNELRVNYRRYRLLQYQAMLRQHGRRGIPKVLAHARWWELLLYTPAVAAYAMAFLFPAGPRMRLQEAIRSALSAYPRFDPRRRTVQYRDILEAARGGAINGRPAP
jgi:glycosyltransferase involved in cell wall biosynthesis